MAPSLARILVLILSASLVLAGCGGGGSSSSSRVVARASAPPPTSAAGSSAGGVLVDVAGRVRRPGVYRLEPGARVHEAIAAAGGARPGADLTSLNRAAPLVDGQQVLVPAAVPAGERGPAGQGGSPAAASVSINQADATALDALPGIGPVTAQKIVAEREQAGPYSSVDDLDRVPGIGPATIESLRDVVTT